MEEISIDYGELIIEKLKELSKLIKKLKDEKKLSDPSEHRI